MIKKKKKTKTNSSITYKLKKANFIKERKMMQ